MGPAELRRMVDGSVRRWVGRWVKMKVGGSMGGSERGGLGAEGGHRIALVRRPVPHRDIETRLGKVGVGLLAFGASGVSQSVSGFWRLLGFRQCWWLLDRRGHGLRILNPSNLCALVRSFRSFCVFIKDDKKM